MVIKTRSLNKEASNKILTLKKRKKKWSPISVKSYKAT